MGSSLSATQQQHATDLHFLLTRNGHTVTKNEVEDLVSAIDDVFPWVPDTGTKKQGGGGGGIPTGVLGW